MAAVIIARHPLQIKPPSLIVCICAFINAYSTYWLRNATPNVTTVLYSVMSLLSFWECLCASSVRTRSYLSENFTFFFLLACFMPVVFVAEGQIQPGQMHSDPTGRQIAHICQTGWVCLHCHIIIFVCLLNQMLTSSRWRWQVMSNIAAKSGGSSVLVNQAFAVLNIIFLSVQGNDNKN